MTPLEIQKAKRAYYRNLCARIREENETALIHYGVKGMKWGVRKQRTRVGNPKPGFSNPSNSGRISQELLKEALRSGKITTKININKQKRHLKAYANGRSYLVGDLAFAQELVDKLSGTGELVPDGDGNWTHRERVEAPSIVGTYVSLDGKETRTNKLMISYSRTGSHIYPRKDEQK